MPSHAVSDNQAYCKRSLTPALLWLSYLGSWLIAAPMAMAQVTPDGSLSTTVNTSGNNFKIENGDRMGNNLFHSFSEFSIPTNGSVFFNNAADIQNIFSRVTGGKISNIDGLIRANGGANLFLLNPAGIVFGPNAQLNIGGSFFGTTANSINFADGTQFSATNPSTSPLLTINVPIGLQWNQPTPASTNVQGTTLSVASGQTIALLGGNVNLNGSTLNAPGGRVELGGLSASGTVQLNGLQGLSFPEGVSRGDVSLSGGSVVNVAAGGNGNIGVNARNLTLSDASKLRAGLGEGLGFGGAVAGNIAINATGNTTLNTRSLIANDVATGAIGNGGSIALTTGSLTLTEGSRIQSVTNSTGTSGEIVIKANGAVNISGFSNDGQFSGILSRSATATSGTGGNITINNPQGTLNLSNQGFIAAVTESSSNGGSIVANLNTLAGESGGQILTATTNSGNAGAIALNVTNSTNFSGENTAFTENSLLTLPAFNVDGLPFSTAANPNVEASGEGGIPYVSIQRTPTQIVSGNTVLGTAQSRVDYYSFSVTTPNSRVIIDLDGAALAGLGVLYLFNRGTGEILASSRSSSPNDGGLGSTKFIETVSRDPYIATTLAEPGVYLIGIAGNDSSARTNQVISGTTLQVGNTYTLNLSVQSPGNLPLPTPPMPEAGVFNPNLSVSSGVFSQTSNAGSGGDIAINTQQLSLSNSAQIFNGTSGLGRGGNLRLNVGALLSLDNADISSFSRSQGNAGNIAITTGRLLMTNTSQLQNTPFAQGNAGTISIVAREEIALFGENRERADRLFHIASSVQSGATGNGGNIFVETPLLRLADSGALRVSNFGLGNAGNIAVRATEIEAIGGTWDTFNASGFFASNLGQGGQGGDISIDAARVRLFNEGRVQTTTASPGNAGNVFIRATESLEIQGPSRTGDFFSGIFSQASPLIGRTGSGGRGGNITVETPALRVGDAGQITSATQSSGNAGNINIRATDVEVSGASVDLSGVSSGISASVGARSTAAGGSITIEADRLRVFDGGQITASTRGRGNGGQIALQLGALDVSGMSQDGQSPSRISSVSNNNFAAGSIDITAGNLQVRDGAAIAVSNTGTGNAGNLNATARNVWLDNGGSLQAEVNGGSQGNINLNVRDSLILRRGSSLTANATGASTGGNITLDSPTIVGLENSDIIANAVQGNGGNIQINTQGIFGLQNRPQLTRESDISASSQFGLSGTINISVLNVNQQNVVAPPPSNFVSTDQVVASSCLARSGNRQGTLTIAGNGGLPETPETATIPYEVVPVLPLQTQSEPLSLAASKPVNSSWKIGDPIVEATEFRINAQGQVELTANQNTARTYSQPIPCQTN